jgi:hypothetical protein
MPASYQVPSRHNPRSDPHACHRYFITTRASPNFRSCNTGRAQTTYLDTEILLILGSLMFLTAFLFYRMPKLLYSVLISNAERLYLGSEVTGCLKSSASTLRPQSSLHAARLMITRAGKWMSCERYDLR